MKTCLLLLLLAGPLAGLATPFDASLLQLGSLPRHASKTQLAQRLGQSARTTRPRYECGSAYVNAPGRTYYQLHYPQATYIGNAASGYELETVHFAPGGAVLRYGAATWDARTTLAAMQKLFGADALLEKDRVPDTAVLMVAARVPSTNQLADSQVRLVFHRGRLVAYTTWQPC